MTTRFKAVLAAAASIAGTILFTIPSAAPAAASSSPWLDRLNQWRAATGVPGLTENTTWDQGDYNHSLYMVKNDQVTHYEVSTLPYYTVAGDTAARDGNIQVSSTTATTDTQSIDWWMAAPFHELGMMDPRLTQTGFGSYREVKSGWDAGFTLDTLRGNSFTGGTYPVYFPGNGSTIPLTTYSGGEFPDPLQACPGYAAPTGLPLTVQVGGNVSTSVSAHAFTGNGLPLAHCVIDSSNAAVGSYLKPRGAVIVIPQQPLQPGVLYAVALTVNGLPYTWSFSISVDGSINAAGTTPAWTGLGGVGSSPLAASAWGSTRTDIFVRGTDGGLWQRTWNGTAWGAWQSLGGILTAPPAAVSWGAGRIDVFVRGTDMGLWQRTFNGTSWSNWSSLGGYLTAGPGVSSQGANSLDVFARGTDGGLWQRTWNGSAWTNWVSLGGILTSDPAPVSWGAGRIDVFVRGTDGGLWQRSWSGAGWSNWASLGGLLVSGPGVSSCATGHLDVFVAGSDHGIYQLGYNGTWKSWQRVGGSFTDTPAVVCPPGTTTVGIYEVGIGSSIVAGTAPGS